ncbi:MAG: hypothetical protein HN350_02820 [Phycisphaerales bacterium]|jgi:hypothetical protein|nr:hypothetical protein [Phycisphaerales bacterium]
MSNKATKRIAAVFAAIVISAILTPARAADYVKKATWHESMFATRQAMVGKRPASMEPAGLPDMSRDPYTIAAWIQTKSDGTIFAKCPPGKRWTRNGKTLFIGGGRIRMDSHSVGSFGGTSRVTDGKWHHVALVGTSKGQIIYVDGKAEATGNLALRPAPKGSVGKIGYTAQDFPRRNSHFTGLIDDVRIYNRVLSAKELASIMAKPDSLSPNGLAGYWPFDSGVMDASGNNNHAISMKGAKLSTGKIGKALDLNGQVKILMTAPGQKQNPNIPIWSFLRKSFTDEAARNEMTWEIEDGIWRNDWKTGDYAALAKRYAAASHRSPTHAKQAGKLAANTKDAAGLAKVRQAYLRSRAYESVMDKLKELDIVGLRRMLGNLEKTGAKTDKTLALLDAIEAKAVKMAETEITPDAMIAFKKDVQQVRYDALIKNNPLMDFEKLLFVKRFKYQSNHYYTDFINGCKTFGGNLCVLDLKSGDVIDLIPEMNTGIFGRFDLHFNADKVVFAWKKEKEEGFRIYEVPIDPKTGKRTGKVRQVLQAPANEKEIQEKYRVGYHHGTDDMNPVYLPDGGIVFISSRCMYGILCDNPDVFCTTLLYRIDADGKNLQKLTNSAVSEATPTILNDGRIMYTRWEYLDKGSVTNKCLWAVRPDGTGQAEIYGSDITYPASFHQGRAIPGTNTKFVFLGVPHYPQNGVGTVIRIDMTKNIRTREPMTYITPDVDVRGQGGFWHDRDGKWGPHRLFKEPFPLSEEFFLVSMNVEKNWKHPTAWDICLLSESGDTAVIHSDPKIGLFQPIPLKKRKTPVVLKGAINPELAKKGLALCIVTDIYQGMEDTPRGSIKYIRVNEQIPRPWASRRRWGGDSYDQQHVTITKDTHLGLKIQVGIVPVEKDGSANFYVPADKNVYFQALDENYMEVQRERTCVNYRPGESRSCMGCHETPNDIVSAKSRVVSALKRKPSTPGPQPGEKSGSKPLYYPVDVQPVLDKHCVKCHSGDKPKGELDLSGTLTTLFSVSYENLVKERRRGNGRRRFDLFPTIGENHPKAGNTEYLPARSLGSHASILIAMHSKGKVKLKDPKQAEIAAKLAKVHEEGKVNLPLEDMIRLQTWVEANGQYYGSYYGRRNLKYKDHPNFRPVPTFENARSTTAPLPEDQR